MTYVDMPTTKPFNNLLETFTPQRRAKIETQVKFALLHMVIVEVQQSLGLFNHKINFGKLEKGQIWYL
jgi:hypothetical protein